MEYLHGNLNYPTLKELTICEPLLLQTLVKERLDYEILNVILRGTIWESKYIANTLDKVEIANGQVCLEEDAYR